MLRKTGQGWMFEEERILEDFIWESLESDLDLIPIKRQFGISGEYCDILARTKNHQLVVLELKNTEDRYIIHQLTRYYHGLKTSEAFDGLVDYTQPIRLIAIAPDFHKHNFIDRRYNLLQFEFIRFSILNQSDNFYLHLYLEGEKELIIQKPIPFLGSRLGGLPSKSKINIELPSRMLINTLDTLSLLAKNEVLRLREKMLGSEKRIKEIKEGRSIFYGRGKTKPCCQLKLILPSQTRQFDRIECYLWLPVPNRFPNNANKPAIGRVYLSLDSDFQTVKTLAYWSPKSRSASFDQIMSADKYFDKVGLDKSQPNIDQLFDLAVKLNLERS